MMCKELLRLHNLVLLYCSQLVGPLQSLLGAHDQWHFIPLLNICDLLHTFGLCITDINPPRIIATVCPSQTIVGG